MIEINKKRLSIFLLIASVVLFTAVYWGLYRFIYLIIPGIPIGIMNIIDLFVIFAYILAGVPASFGLKKFLLFILSKEPKDN